MFESTLLPILRDDPVIPGLVGTYGSGNRPSIFSDFAPEGASLPYIVFTITRISDTDLTIQRFSLNVDFYDYCKSAVNSREFAERIEYLLDRRKLDSTRYGAIRIFKFGGGPVVEDDPRAIHYNMQFEVRAGRKAWGQHNITTIGE